MPPLKAVRYFELAAEFESFSRAAADLRVSKGAVSQQITQLEQYFGVPLFSRTGRGVTLTDAGRRYHSAARNAFNILETETERVAGSRVRGHLKLTVLPAFASLWLVPRLPAFQASAAHLDIVISAEAEVVDFAKSDAHIGIRYGAPAQGGLKATVLGQDALTPVCTSGYAELHNIRTAEDLSRCVLLHDTYWPDDWPRWLTEAGIADRLGGDGQFFTHYSMAIDTARAGGGVAMGHRLLLRDMIDRGELVCPLEGTIHSLHPYVVVVPDTAAHLDVVKRFRNWLVESFGPEGALSP
ncbi:LysR substrate-binding domain-containing protein [Pelagibius sp.]|uniref:LysR substrate-binding domain-containing protein n=1 Tax=Pelagibius sp. TaxID=1931238 RepID=UPI002607154D|nr:LysR substrate-binding domain-containing protein [Pelagibius sp.]